MKQDKKNTLMMQIHEELEKTNNLALEVRKDFLLGESTTAEYACYVALCIKRLNILTKIVENLGIPDNNPYKQEFYELENKLKPALLQMKRHAGTATDTITQITCNALLNSFKNRFGVYLTETELEEAITV